MEFASVKKENLSSETFHHDGKAKVSVEIDELLKYPLPINFYSVPPAGQLELDEAEDLVSERIKLLRVLETSVEGENFTQSINNMRTLLTDVKPAKGGPDAVNFYIGSNLVTRAKLDYRRKDHVSHFLLRLLCCRTDALKKWFIWHETKFLQFQLLDERNLPEIGEFLRLNNMDFEEVTDVEKRTDLLTDAKVNWDYSRMKQSPALQKVFKLPFEEALELVRTRRVFLERGNAYVLSTDMVSIICMRFRIELSAALASMSRRLPILNEDDRLIPRFNSVYNDLITKVDMMKKADEKLANKERITPDMIDDLAKESFSPCMRSIHENLRKNHHLKHYGRLHYGLFLKSVGMTLQDALQFFKEEFVQIVTPERFAKEYSYNIRYNYGQEGKKTSLSAYGCKKIITENPPGPDDTHGCPFRHFDRDNLSVMLRRYGADDDAVIEMLALVEKKDYTNACTRYFKCKHPNYPLRSETGQIYHPNQFFSESRRAHRGIIDFPAGGDGEEDANEVAEVIEGEERQFDDEDLFEDAFEDDLKKMTDGQFEELSQKTCAENQDQCCGDSANVPSEPFVEDRTGETESMDVEEDKEESMDKDE